VGRAPSPAALDFAFDLVFDFDIALSFGSGPPKIKARIKGVGQILP
jgi:hypothetical protein